MDSVHKTVLLNETIDGLNLTGEPKVVDCTFGGGGHTLQVCKRFPKAHITAFDQDESAFLKAKNKFTGGQCNIHFVNRNFRDLTQVLGEEKFDGIIFDLGLSSDQLENSGRGFSFLKDEPLLMTMKENPLPEDLTAKDVVNTWEEQSLADVIYGYGEERYARRIAKAIVEARESREIQTTKDLVEIIESAVPQSYKRHPRQGGARRIHPATKTFQALRIAVNDELGSLEQGLRGGFESLKPEGRMSVISFHSLEDRIVKKFFREMVQSGRAKLINKKPITGSEDELKENPRARSAKLRILEKIN